MQSPPTVVLEADVLSTVEVTGGVGMSIPCLIGAERSRSIRILTAFAAVIAASIAQASCTAVDEASGPACVDSEQNLAAASATAHACGHRVEDLSSRSEAAQVFANPDGTSTMEIAAVPQRVRRADGSWTPVDTALRPNADGSLSPAATIDDVRFSGGGTAPLVAFTRNGRQFTMSWPAPLPAPVVAGDTATYADVLPGVDLLVQATAIGYSHVLAVKDAAAAANPALREIEYVLGGTGVEITATADGGVSVAGDDGSEILRASGAAMWDSSIDSIDASDRRSSENRMTAGIPGSAARSTAGRAGERARVAAVPSRLAGDRFVLEPDAGSLARGPFPVYVDPAWVAPGPSRWAYSNSGNENNETSVARVGRSPDSGRTYRSYFEFPTSSGGRTLLGSRIISATFSIVLYHSWSCGPSPVYLWRTAGIATTPKTAWAPPFHVYLNGQSVAANKDACFTPSTPTVFFGGNLTGDLQAVVNAGWAAYTVALSAADAALAGETTASRWKKFFPNTALLTVNFNHAPAAPAAADLSIAPSLPCGSTPIGVNATNGVTLRATLSDSDGDNVAAQWQVTGISPQYAPPDSGFAAPGASFSTTIPAAAFTDGEYSWTVRATDGTDTGAYAPACPFVVDNTPPDSPSASSTDLALTTGLIVPAPPPTAVVGRIATVTLSPPVDDPVVAGYLIGVGAGVEATPSVWVPARQDGTAQAPIVPVAPEGTTNILTVRVRDLAGQAGPTVTYRFRATAAASAPRVRGDATGDGRADVSILSDVGGGNGAFWRWNTAASGTSSVTPTAPQDVTTTYPASAVRKVQGDFDGDGLTDFALFRQQGSDVTVSIQRSDRNGLLGSQAATLTGWSLASMRPLAGNFDGDPAGRDDLAAFYNDGNLGFSIRVLRSTGSPGAPSFASPATWHTNPAGTADWNLSKQFAGDFDGDGRADFAHIYQYPSCQTKLWVHYSSGTAMGQGLMLWDSGVNNWCWDRSDPVVADYDGDSRADIAMLYRYDGCLTGLWSFYGNANRTISPAGAVSWMSAGGAWCADRTEMVAGDFNSDGRADIGAIYRCCGGFQLELYQFASTGRAFNAPSLMWEGAAGPVGVLSNAGASAAFTPRVESAVGGGVTP